MSILQRIKKLEQSTQKEEEKDCNLTPEEWQTIAREEGINNFTFTGYNKEALDLLWKSYRRDKREVATV